MLNALSTNKRAMEYVARCDQGAFQLIGTKQWRNREQKRYILFYYRHWRSSSIVHKECENGRILQTISCKNAMHRLKRNENSPNKQINWIDCMKWQEIGIIILQCGTFLRFGLRASAVDVVESAKLMATASAALPMYVTWCQCINIYVSELVQHFNPYRSGIYRSLIILYVALVFALRLRTHMKYKNVKTYRTFLRSLSLSHWTFAIEYRVHKSGNMILCSSVSSSTS